MIDVAGKLESVGRGIAALRCYAPLPAVFFGATVLVLMAWAGGAAMAASAQGGASVLVESNPAAVTVQENPVVTVSTVSNNNSGTGVTSQASGPIVVPATPTTRQATATEASFGLSGAPNQAVSISVPSSAVMTIGNQVVEISGMELSGGAAQKLGDNGSGTFGIELSQVTVANAAELSVTTASGAVEALALDGTTALAGQVPAGGAGLTGPVPINRSDPFGMVTNVGPYFYVMISYY